LNTFLERILQTKAAEVASLRSHRVAHSRTFPLPEHRFSQALTLGDHLQIIAEVKKASPSKGAIALEVVPRERASQYAQAGAAAVSVLTDRNYFQGSIEDLESVRGAVSLPILRKDFIVDEVQIDEAYEAGADAILLIVAALQRNRLVELREYAKHLGLDVLVEVHEEEELDAALSVHPEVLGINHRNLHTFEVSLETTERLMPFIPRAIPVISESGIRSREDAERMANAGANGLLVGETLMLQGEEGLAGMLDTLRVPRQPRFDRS
jgi:indole-3-glycerol phosphate synthase